MKVQTFSTYVLPMNAFLTMAEPKRLPPDRGREFLIDVYPSLAAALAIGFDEEDDTTRQAFGFLRSELAELYSAAATAWSTKRPARLEYEGDPGWAEFLDGNLDLARVVACQHLGRAMQGGPQDFGFDLLADLLVSRLDAAAKAEKGSKARKVAA